MSERRGTKALELWCRRITDGYTGVNVQNMTTSWRDGLAFCAMIHHFRPDLIDFDSLDKNDIYGNNELAFRIAEQHLGIPALLDAEDMASCSVPDRLSILTYLSQFYQTFGGSSPARLSVKRPTETTDEREAQIPDTTKEKVMPYLSVRKDVCAVCGLPVFLAEKLVLSRTSYHRTCFRCARCDSQLTLGNYYETEDGQYCCETCPDEEISSPSTESCNGVAASSEAAENHDVTNSLVGQTRGAKDSLAKDVFMRNPAKLLDHKDTSIPDLIAQTSLLRLNFMSSQLLTENDCSIIDKNLNSIQESCGHEKSSGTEVDGLVDPVNIEDAGNDNLNIDEQSGKGLEDSSGVTVIENEETPVDTTQTLNCNNSLVEQGRKMFGNKKQQFEGKNVESELHKSNDSDKLTYSIIDSVATEVHDNGESNFINSVENIIIEESKQNFVTAFPTTPLAYTSSASESPKFSPSNRKILYYQACKTYNNDNNTGNSVIPNVVEDYPEDLNPFKSDSETEVVDKAEEIMNTSQRTTSSTNPFECEEQDCGSNCNAELIPPKPAVRTNVYNRKPKQQFHMEKVIKRKLPAPHINLNPFWSDEDDNSSDLDSTDQLSEFTPVPKPRTIKHIQVLGSDGQKSEQKDLYTLTGCVRSPQEEVSFGGTYRKKNLAPSPPNKKDVCYQQQTGPTAEVPDSTAYHGLPSHFTSKEGRAKSYKEKAPQPPILSGSSTDPNNGTRPNFLDLQVDKVYDGNSKCNEWKDEKTNKDETNRTRQSIAHISCEENFHYKSYVNKSKEGKWKRKKGPAPPCPTPHRRKIKVMSVKDVKMELDEIELQQQGLEKQGVRLEQLIRSKCECGSRSNDVSTGTDVEELVLELFGLVNEKNELFRRQAELMLLRRQQRLEEEHAEVEYQIRCLMMQHESTKTDFDKQKEEALIQRLVEIVERRNEIVDCLEMDRRREIEEDRSIHKHMDIFAARNKNNESSSNYKNAFEKKKRKQNKLKDKTRDIKFKKAVKKDADKDIDEIELKLKHHTKRKWF